MERSLVRWRYVPILFGRKPEHFELLYDRRRQREVAVVVHITDNCDLISTDCILYMIYSVNLRDGTFCSVPDSLRFLLTGSLSLAALRSVLAFIGMFGQQESLMLLSHTTVFLVHVPV